MNEVSNKKIEIHSEQVNDILSRPPAWILRWGITLFFVVLIAIFVGSIFFKYPDIISAQVIISSTNLPVHLRAKTSGKIERFFVKDGEAVTPGTVTAIIESATDYNDFIVLQQQCSDFRERLYEGPFKAEKSAEVVAIGFPLHLNLGNIQSSYTQFLKSLNDYKIFLEADYHAQKVALIRRQMTEQQEILHLGERQLYNYEEQYLIQQSAYARDSTLFAQGVIPLADMEQGRLKWLAAAQQYENLKSSITNMRLTLLQSEQTIFELTQEQSERCLQFENSLTGSFDLLISQMAQWEQTNLIVSPIIGKAVFTRYWQENQHVNTGDLVLSIIPEEKAGISGKLYLPLQGAGKVRTGQRANIKLDNFPYMEFGMVETKITYISAVPAEISGVRMIIADVDFPKGLITNYNLPVESGEEMSGTADVITEDISLFVRLLSPIKHVFKSRL